MIDGPVCNEGYAWWQVDYEGAIGWTAEGDGTTYWTEPLVTITPDNAADVIQMAGLGRDGNFIGFSPDRRILAMTTPTGVQLLNVADLAAPAREIDPLRQIDQAVFSPDWRLLATVGRSMPDHIQGSSLEPDVRLFDVASGRLLHAFEGADWHIAFSPDGSLLYSDSRSRAPWTGHVWDTATYAELATPEGYSQVLGIAWNNTLLAVDADGMVWQWDPRRGAIVGDEPFLGPLAEGSYAGLGAPQINPTGTLLIAKIVSPAEHGGPDQLPALWDLTTGALRYTLDDRLASLDWESGLMVKDEYSRETGPGLRVMEIATGRALGFLPLYVDYPWENRDPLHIPLHLGGTEWMAVSPDRSLIALKGPAGGDASCDGEVGVWELATGQFRFSGYAGCAGPVLFHPVTGELMYTRTADDIRLWNPADNLPFDPMDSYPAIENRPDIRSVRGGVRTYIRAVFGERGGLLVAEDVVGHLHAWDTTTWRELPDLPELMWFGQFALDPASSILAFPGSKPRRYGRGPDGTLRLWDVRAGQEIGQIGSGDMGQMGSMAISPARLDSDGYLVAVIMPESYLALWDSASPARPLATLRVPDNSGLAFNPDGSLLAIGNRILDVSSVLAQGKVPVDQPYALQRATLDRMTRARLATENSSFRPLHSAFSSDGTRLVTAGAEYEASLTVWDVTNGMPLYSLKFSEMEPASSAAFSPDGRLLAVTTGEGCCSQNRGHLYLYDAATGKLLAAPEGHRGAAWDVAFSPDGRLIASAGGGCTGCESYGWDDTIRLWQVDPDR